MNEKQKQTHTHDTRYVREDTCPLGVPANDFVAWWHGSYNHVHTRNTNITGIHKYIHTYTWIHKIHRSCASHVPVLVLRLLQACQLR
jgi:hypothetical protein